jgi:hypothetical protein
MLCPVLLNERIIIDGALMSDGQRGARHWSADKKVVKITVGTAYVAK